MMSKRTLLTLIMTGVIATLVTVLGAWSSPSGDSSDDFCGTWYMELDTGPFGLPGGALPALLSIHSDGTYLIFDGGDFGGAPINLVQSPMFGSWVSTGMQTFEATSLFFAGDSNTGETSLIKRVRFTFQFMPGDPDRLQGLGNVEQLECSQSGPTPFVTFNCPNPISSPDSAFVPVPGTPPDLPVSAWRLNAR